MQKSFFLVFSMSFSLFCLSCIPSIFALEVGLGIDATNYQNQPSVYLPIVFEKFRLELEYSADKDRVHQRTVGENEVDVSDYTEETTKSALGIFYQVKHDSLNSYYGIRIGSVTSTAEDKTQKTGLSRSGSVMSIAFGVEYMFIRNFSLGAELDLLESYHTDAKTDDYKYDIEGNGTNTRLIIRWYF